MKKAYILFGLVILLGLSMADTPNTIYHPFFAKTYPDPAMPGQMVRVEITLQNMGSQTFYNISTELKPTWPFSGNQTKGFIQRLDPKETATVVYYLNVAKDAKPGQYTLLHKLSYYYGEWNEANERTYYFKVETTRTIGINVKNRERIEINNLDYPSQVLAGGSGEIKAVVNNTGSVPVNDIKVSLESNSFFLTPLAPTNQYVDILNPGDQKDLEFRFKASSTATTGTYSMSLKVGYGSTNYEIPITVSILGYPGIQVSSVKFTSVPEPGKETEMTLCIKNMGADLSNFYISLTAYPLGQTSVGSIEQNQDIVVIGTGTKFVRSLKAEETKCFNFSLALSEDTMEKPYYLYLQFFGGNFQETSIPVGINVKGVPSLSLSDIGYDQDQLFAGVPFKMSVQLENSGTGKAKKVKAVLDGETVYLGSIDADDSGTAIFRLKLEKPGKQRVNLVVTYYDKDGKEYKQEFSLDIMVSEKPFDIGLVVWIIMGIVIVFLVYRVIKK